MNKTIPPLLCLVLLISARSATAQHQFRDRSEIDRSSPPAHWEIPPAPPRSPEETVRSFELPAGFRAEVVASEPLVQDPIAMAFDERGRLWVLEWPSYNWPLREVFPDLREEDPPKSRLAVLEDTNGDGRMDRRTVFLDNFDWPRGLQLTRGGVILFAFPEVIFARDTSGDGRADQQEILIGGLDIPANPHGAAGSPTLGLDNWLYALRVPERRRFADGRWIVQPTSGLSGQWGVSRDNFGRFFYSGSSDPVRGDFVPGHYLARNPNHPSSAGLNERIMHDRTTWPHAGTPGSNRRLQLRDEDGTLQVFTAATGPAVYRGGQFPAEFSGNVFFGETAGRFLRRTIVTDNNGILTAENAYDRREFLFSHDERFRPTFVTTGPDGALYVADMYRGIIEGHIFVSTFLYRQILERNLHQPFNGMGRIYRIVHEDRPLAPLPQVEGNDPAGWVQHLGHSNGFWRDTAQRLIVESGDRSPAPRLRSVAVSDPDELARLHALWTLEGLGALDASTLARGLTDTSYRIRQAALRLSEPFLSDPAHARRAFALASDERIEVRRQLLFSLGEGRGAGFERAMATVLQRDAAEPMMIDAALSGLQGREWALLARLLNDASWKEKRPGSESLFAALASAIMNSGDAAQVDHVLAAAAGPAGNPGWQQVALLEGLVRARNKALAAAPPALATAMHSANPEVRARAETLFRSLKLPADRAPVTSAVEPADRAQFERGQALYTVCSACHGPDGRGMVAVAPPLAGSPLLSGDPNILARIVLGGRDENPAYPDMPPLPGLGDEQIAAILTYVRTAWAGMPKPVTAQQVQSVRDGR